MANAVEHGHTRGVLHRDLKPANIMFDEEVRPDCMVANGATLLASVASGGDLANSARIVDFGLAKTLHATDGPTKSGAMLGTPAYMSPEQASGDNRQIGRPSDVYSLGATLYELLTGRPPHVGDSDVDTIVHVKDDEPVRPRRLRRHIPRDLETICLKCLAKSPAARYPTAKALGDDLRRFLRNEPILARPTPSVVAAWRWCKRHPIATALAGLMLMLSVMGPLVAINQTRLHQEAEVAREETRRMLYISDMNLALQDWEDGNLNRVGNLLARHQPTQGQADLRGFEWYYLARLHETTKATPTLRFNSGVTSLAEAPLGEMLAVGHSDGTISIWDRKRSRTAMVLSGHDRAPVVQVAYSPDGKRLASAGHDQHVRVWDLESQTQINHISGSDCMAFSPDGRTIACPTNDLRIQWWDYATGKLRVSDDAHADNVCGLAFSPSGDMLATASWDNTIGLWDVASGQLRTKLEGHNARVWCVAFSADGKMLASGDVEWNIKLWDVATSKERDTLHGHRGTILSLAFTKQRDLLASGGADNAVCLWQASTGRSNQAALYASWSFPTWRSTSSLTPSIRLGVSLWRPTAPGWLSPKPIRSTYSITSNKNNWSRCVPSPSVSNALRSHSMGCRW